MPFCEGIVGTLVVLKEENGNRDKIPSWVGTENAAKVGTVRRSAVYFRIRKGIFFGCEIRLCDVRMLVEFGG